MKVGTLVVHVKMPEWGPGRVLDVQGDRLTIYFRDAPKSGANSIVKVIDLSRGLLELSPVQTDPWLDNLPIRDGRLALTKPPLTLEGAIAAFLKRYPEGFLDSGYLGNPKVKGGERNYKLSARQRYVDLLDGGVGEKLLADDDVAELAKRVLKVVGPPLNLLSPSFELVPFKQGIGVPAAARNYFAALFEVVRAGVPQRDSFERLIAAVEGLPSKGESTADSWPVLTVVPFLARPSAFMFLKPTITQQAARWLGYDLAYEATLNWRTYD